MRKERKIKKKVEVSESSEILFQNEKEENERK
jgi:hypothetical protein